MEQPVVFLRVCVCQFAFCFRSELFNPSWGGGGRKEALMALVCSIDVTFVPRRLLRNGLGRSGLYLHSNFLRKRSVCPLTAAQNGAHLSHSSACCRLSCGRECLISLECVHQERDAPGWPPQDQVPPAKPSLRSGGIIMPLL